MNSPFPQLFQPYHLRNLDLRNRIVMPPMVTNYASPNGFVTDRLRDYYAARARGGVGLVIVEATCVESRAGRGFKGQILIDDDRFLPGLRELTREVKAHGAKIAVQVHHAGSETGSRLIGVQPVAPSPIPKPGGEVPRELTTAEVESLIQRFAKAAQRAQRAGFDGVEIHGAHGYLIAQFLSSFFNRRTDAYGGGIEGRARFLTETIRAAKKLTGEEYPVWFRMNGREFGPEGGFTGEEAQKVAQMAQEAGADAVHVSAFAYGISPRATPPMAQPPGNLVRFAETVKRAVTIPVIAVGRIDPPTGEAVLKENRADLVAIGRALIVDPELPQKAATGRLEQVRPCIACQTCFDCIEAWREPLRCAVNPAAGRERESVVHRAERRKKIFVVGGGPGGMEAARVGALRGHDVVLYERAQELGGQLLLAAVPPHKAILARLVAYQRSQLPAVGVRVELGRGVDASLVDEVKPDVVILATGAENTVPRISGVENPRVATAVDVLAGKADVGQKVAVIGAELVGCETAEFLADAGRQVTVMRRGDEVATKVNPTNREHLLARLAAKGIAVLTGVRYQEITDHGVVIATREGETRTIAADTVVLAAGSSVNDELYRNLEGKVAELCRVGDCVEPRDILSAVTEGYFTALGL
jgi:2,4-dienoyl-CoA reductase-like NADH-dependent reductase (Old Yellow Enzyme family)/thioredoxin reductase